MRRIWPHLLILLTGLVCLALTWHFEPPIRFQPSYAPPGLPLTKTNSGNQYLRVVATQPLHLRELTLRLRWDPKQVADLQVLRGYLTRQIEPRTEVHDNTAIITLVEAHGGRALLSGRGALLRLLFRQLSAAAGPDAVRIEAAIGVAPNGRKMAVKTLRVQPMETPRPPAKPGAAVHPNEDRHG